MSRKAGSWFMLAGAIPVTVTVILDLDTPEGIKGYTFMLFVACILIPLTARIGKEKEAHQKEQLDKVSLAATKARLENELIKNSIQPHFLMNTLNAIIDWVEEDPKTGVAFIHELSRHFRILLQVSGKREIPLADEIELCKSLLAIMSYRKETRYRLRLEEVDPSNEIPPLTLHTLVENGVTHNESASDEVVFTLWEESSPNMRAYTLETPWKASSVGNKQASSRGTGLKYVRSRLEESYPGRWKLESAHENDRWVTRIEIRHEVAEVPLA